MDVLLNQLRENLRDRQLFQRGERILVAVSGGVDSMVLLHALNSFSAQMAWNLTVAHLNHLLRGRSSNGDARFVETFSKRLGVGFCGSVADVRTIARQHSISLEMAGRQARHAFFQQAARDNGCSSVALAHHADDQVELFFLRLFRGSGEGLGGMQWIAPLPKAPSVRLVRPLLNLSKAVLLDYAARVDISFRKDASNADLDFQRNRIRHELLPLLRRKYQPGIDSVITRTMDILSAEADCVEEIARKWVKTHRPDFTSIPIAVQRRALQSQLIAAGIVPEFAQVESLRLASHQPVNLSKAQRSSMKRGVEGMGSQLRHRTHEATVARDADGNIYFPEPSEQIQVDPGFELPIELSPQGELNFEAGSLIWRIENRRGCGVVTRSKGRGSSEFFDADKLGERIILRYWRPGDRFWPIGMSTSVKLQDLFTNAKIPHNQRRTLILATTGRGEIFWVEGLRISEGFKLTAKTRRRLMWQWKRT